MRRKSVAEERPELVTQWDPINELSPDKVSCGSHLKVWWICERGHKWEAVVKNRALLSSGCPYCEHRAVLRGYNDLQTVAPKLAKTWSKKNKLKPYEVSPNSNTEVLWQCKNKHEWKARVADRFEGHGCPYCAGQRVWKGYNDLLTTHPNLIPEWSNKNIGVNPEEITYKNRSNVWWHCSICGNDYQAVVNARAKGRICPFCLAKEIRGIREQRLNERKIQKDFVYLLPQLATIYYARKYKLRFLIESESPVGVSVTVYIPSIHLIVDVCNSKKEIIVKKLICEIKGINYVNMPEKLSEIKIINKVRKAFSTSLIFPKTSASEDLKMLREKYYHWEMNKDVE